MKYNTENPRLNVNFINSDTEEVLFTIKNRDWMNVGELMTAHYVSQIIENELKNSTKKPPKNIIVMISKEFELEQ